MYNVIVESCDCGCHLPGIDAKTGWPVCCQCHGRVKFAVWAKLDWLMAKIGR
jgi:hypothetical protein